MAAAFLLRPQTPPCTLASTGATPVVWRKGEMAGRGSGGEGVGSVENPGTH